MGKGNLSGDETGEINFVWEEGRKKIKRRKGIIHK